MQEYQEILKDTLNYALHTLPLLIIGIFLLVRSIKQFIICTKYIKDKKYYFYILIPLIVAIFFISFYINDAGITCTKIYLDYKNKSYTKYEGFIQETSDGNTINKTVTISGVKFIVSRETQQFMRENKGEYCLVVFGSRSRYIVDYYLVALE